MRTPTKKESHIMFLCAKAVTEDIRLLTNIHTRGHDMYGVHGTLRVNLDVLQKMLKRLDAEQEQTTEHTPADEQYALRVFDAPKCTSGKIKRQPKCPATKRMIPKVGVATQHVAPPLGGPTSTTKNTQVS